MLIGAIGVQRGNFHIGHTYMHIAYIQSDGQTNEFFKVALRLKRGVMEWCGYTSLLLLSLGMGFMGNLAC